MEAKKKILIADDEPDLLEVVKGRLEAAGFSVTTAASDEEALEKFKEEKFDGVFIL